MELSKQQLEKLIPNNKKIDEWFEALTSVLPNYEINTKDRLACFLAQCMHESGDFSILEENLNYRAESLRKVFPKYFPTDELAKQYERKPEKIANRVYSNRMGNGPEESGDGYTYRGRGLIQVTGKENYTRFAEDLQIPFEDVVDYIQTFEGAVKSACWFWQKNKLNQYADKGDMVTLTKRINGGTNGLDDRIKKYNKALEILSE